MTGGTDLPCTCLRLRQAARQVTRLYDRRLEPAGLRITQFPVLALLRADGPAPLGQLAERLVTDRTTLTRNLRPMEQAGLIETRADPEDRRRRLLVITKQGRAVLRRAAPLWRAAQDELATLLGPELRGRLMGDLDEVIARID